MKFLALLLFSVAAVFAAGCSNTSEPKDHWKTERRTAEREGKDTDEPCWQAEVELNLSESVDYFLLNPSAWIPSAIEVPSDHLVCFFTADFYDKEDFSETSRNGVWCAEEYTIADRNHTNRNTWVSPGRSDPGQFQVDQCIAQLR